MEQFKVIDYLGGEGGLMRYRTERFDNEHFVMLSINALAKNYCYCGKITFLKEKHIYRLDERYPLYLLFSDMPPELYRRGTVFKELSDIKNESNLSEIV